jgi:uncharacterized protein YodC (DUF2158 family)
MVVRLKSGGPAMTVGYETSDNGWMCVWFDNELRSGDFAALVLEPAEPDVWPFR